MNRKKMLVEKQEEVERQIEVRYNTTKFETTKVTDSLTHNKSDTLTNLQKYWTRSFYIKSELCPVNVSRL